MCGGRRRGEVRSGGGERGVETSDRVGDRFVWGEFSAGRGLCRGGRAEARTYKSKYRGEFKSEFKKANSNANAEANPEANAEANTRAIQGYRRVVLSGGRLVLAIRELGVCACFAFECRAN